MIVNAGTTASFKTTVVYKFKYIETYWRMRKTSGTPYSRSFTLSRYGEETILYDSTFEKRMNVSSEIHSDNISVSIEISNVSMNDNGTYMVDDRHITACFTLFILEIKTEPNNNLEENEPILVYGEPRASLIKRSSENVEMEWLLEGQFVNQTASFIQEDGQIWIPSVSRNLNRWNVTYRAVYDDEQIIEVNATLIVKYGPNQPLELDPKGYTHILQKGDILPDITCSSDCNPPCNISWGNHGRGSTLSLGVLITEDTGKYTCTATRSGRNKVEQTISIYVIDNCYFIPAVTSLTAVQAIVILVLGVLILFKCKRKCLHCFHKDTDSKKNKQAVVTFSTPAIQRSENECYEELGDGTGIKRNTYSEVNIAITDDEATQPSVSIYENIKVGKKTKNTLQK